MSTRLTRIYFILYYLAISSILWQYAAGWMLGAACSASGFEQLPAYTFFDNQLSIF
jgi:hypothetical protein